MTSYKLGFWALTGALALSSVPACGDDENEALFADSGGGAGRGGGSSSGRGGGAGDSTSAGSGGEAPDNGGSPSGGETSSGGQTSSGGETSSGGQTSSGGSAQGGSSSGGQGDAGGLNIPDDATWFCNASPSDCICVQDAFASGECGGFDCCYVYDSGVAGVACACNDSADDACDANVANLEGARVDACPP